MKHITLLAFMLVIFTGAFAQDQKVVKENETITTNDELSERTTGYIRGLWHVQTFGCTKGEITVDAVGNFVEYTWKIGGGKIVIPNVGGNTYTGSATTIFVDPIDGPYGFDVIVTAKDACGNTTTYRKHIPTRCESGEVTPL